MLGVAALAVATVGAFLSWGRLDLESGSQPPERIRVGVYAGDTAALFWVAHEYGFLRREGLEVEIAEFEAGKLAFQALLRGDVDVATCAEFVVVSSSFERPDFRVFGSIAEASNHKLVARRDRAIQSPKDLAGKTVGVTRGSSGEFFLGSLLLHHGLAIDDLEVVDLTPSKLVSAITAGEIDAVLSWEPNIFSIEQELGANALTISGQAYQDYYFVLVALQPWLKENPVAARKLLAALVRAEQQVAGNPAEAKSLLARRFELSEGYVESAWKAHRFTVTLPQALLPAMESEARWMMESGLVDDTAGLSNYLQILHLPPLQEVSPEAVTVIQ